MIYFFGAKRSALWFFFFFFAVRSTKVAVRPENKQGHGKLYQLLQVYVTERDIFHE